MTGHPGVQQQQQPTKDVQIQDGTNHRGSPAIVGGELEHGEGRLEGRCFFPLAMNNMDLSEENGDVRPLAMKIWDLTDFGLWEHVDLPGFNRGSGLICHTQYLDLPGENGGLTNIK